MSGKRDSFKQPNEPLEKCFYILLYSKTPKFSRGLLNKLERIGVFIMEKKEKIKKVYTKYGVDVDDKTIELLMTDEERTKGVIKLYKQEELESMNYILGKPAHNEVYTKFELDAMGKVDLFDRQVVNVCKMIWDNRNNPEQLARFQQILNERMAN